MCVCERQAGESGGGAKYSFLAQDGWLMEEKHNGIAALVEPSWKMRIFAGLGTLRLKEAVGGSW